MVDKVDKPDAPNPYRISSPTEAKKDKPKEERRQEDLPTYKEEDSSVFREKFKSGSTVLKTLRVPLEKIQKLLFRRAMPHHGTPTAEADLIWQDGRSTENVLFLLKNWQDFLKIKNLKSGTEIPPPLWSYRKPYLEISIRQREQTSGSWNIKEMQRQSEAKKEPPKKEVNFSFWQRAGLRLRILDPKTTKLNVTGLILYVLGFLALVIYLMILMIGI